MPSFITSVAVPVLALAGSALANPFKRGNDACLAAVTGKAALGDDNLRKEHCSSFIKTIVTPAAFTVTTTITDKPEPTGWSNYKRDVTVCPNEVPNYASACDEKAYKSACKAFGISSETTFTIPATTTTKTVYKAKADATCTATTETKTVTEDKGTATITKTVTSTLTGGIGGATGRCISKEKADYFVLGFIELLEYTSYAGDNKTGVPAGRGYHQEKSNEILHVDFVDYSDSINWMAKFPMGGATFANKAAFDFGQGKMQPEVKVKTLNTWYGCNTITWRWELTPPTRVKIIGINQFIVSDDGSQLIANYAEFNNAYWLNSFGLQCKTP